MRLLIVSILMTAAGGYLARATAEPVPARESLKLCPLTISDWSGQAAPDFDARTLSVLGVDEYINRIYLNPSGKPVGLYVGYYGSQRQGDTMHSPLNCLPGAGWSPVSFSRMDVSVSSEASAPPIRVNRYLIEKGLERQLVLYWYQSHGRIVASEYLGKFYLVLDAIRMNRTDGALVRVVAPVTTSEGEAERSAVEFTRVVYPLLASYLPS